MLLGWLALLGKGRGATNRGDEVDVPAAAVAAGRHDDALPGLRQVGELVEGFLRLGVKLADNGPQRDAEHEVRAIGTVATRTLAVRAALGPEVVLIAVVDKGGQLRVRHNDDVAAVAAVAAVGTALGHVGLAPERHASGAAVSALDVDVGKVGKGVVHVLLLVSRAAGPRVLDKRKGPRPAEVP